MAQIGSHPQLLLLTCHSVFGQDGKPQDAQAPEMAATPSSVNNVVIFKICTEQRRATILYKSLEKMAFFFIILEQNNDESAVKVVVSLFFQL